MKYATLAQGNQVLSLILQKKLTADQLQQLQVSGLISTLLEAGKCTNLTTVNPFEFRKILGLPEVDFVTQGPVYKLYDDIPFVLPSNKQIASDMSKINVGYESLLRTAGCQGEDADEDILQARLYGINRGSIDGAFDVLGEYKIVPAGRTTLARFASRNPVLESLGKVNIIALGSVWNTSNARRYWEYAMLSYMDGKIFETKRVKNESLLILNGGQYFSRSRDFFLCAA